MSNPISVRPEPAKAFTARQEIEILRNAVGQSVSSPALRLRLAKLYYQVDEFGHAISVLTPLEDGDGVHVFEAMLMLSAAYLARGGADDYAPACVAAERAVALATDDRALSTALSEQAKAFTRAGEREAARTLLLRALALDPQNWRACKRLVSQLLADRDPDAVIALTDRLALQGARYSRLLSARTMAFAQMGRFDEARQVTNLPEFLYRRPIDIPAGWDDLKSFNASIADELMAHPGIRYGRHGTASEKTWRIDTPATGKVPATRALLEQIAGAVERYSDGLSGLHHPWAAARPLKAALRSWCVITGSEGFEQWHMHHLGWMTGGYYVKVPERVMHGEDTAGCLTFGLPGGLIGNEAARNFGEQIVRPKPGMLTLFPSHCYHRTFAHGDEHEQRICIAFDVLAG